MDPELRTEPTVVTVVGRSGSGKTALCTALLRHLGAGGIRCAAIKSAGHDLHLDTEGKDSARLRASGGAPTVVVGPTEFAWFGQEPPPLARIIGLFTDVEVVIVEGFRSAGLPTILIEDEASASHDPDWAGPSGDVIDRIAPHSGGDWPTSEQVTSLAGLVMALRQAD